MLKDFFTHENIDANSLMKGEPNEFAYAETDPAIIYRYGPLFRKHIPNQYVLGFGQPFLSKDQAKIVDIASTTLIRKPEGTLHAGMWNLPGGKIEPGETPAAAVVREYIEETGLNASFPFYLGEITDFESYVVYVFRLEVGGRLSSGTHEQRQVVLRNFQWKPDVLSNIPLLLSLGFTGCHHWTIVEANETIPERQFSPRFEMIPARVTDAYMVQPEFRKALYGSHKKRDGVEAK